MWNSSQGGGGFMAGEVSSPSVSGGSGAKGKRAQNIVPVMIQDVLSAPEEGFSIEDIEVGFVIVVGKVINAEQVTTKTTYKIEDDTGSLDVIMWMDEGRQDAVHPEGSYIKAVGSIRTQGEKKHVMAFTVAEAPSQEERDYHSLDAVYSKLKMKQVNQKQSGKGAFSDNGGLSNSMMGGSFGGGMGGGASFGGASSSDQSFGNKNYDLVYSLIRQSREEQGIDVSTIGERIKGRMNTSEMNSALEFLACEGHIYTTVDEDHYKATTDD